MQKSAAIEVVHGSEILVAAQWEAKLGEADRVADILRRFLPQAQSELGVKLFPGRSKFLFYELFADEAAFADHQASNHFKTSIAGEALPHLAKRERRRYTLL